VTDSIISRSGAETCRSCFFWDRYGPGKWKICAVWKCTTRPGDGCDSWTKEAE
jgi:hypothetical protein